MPAPDLAVLHVDNHLLVIDKPAGLPTVPDDSGDTSALDAAKAWVKREFDKPGNVFLGVVHRLDRPVSGVMVFARTSKAAARLTAQFRDRHAGKTYLGLGAGSPPEDAGELRQRLWKDRDRNRVHVLAPDDPREGARDAVTAWRATARRRDRVLLELRPRTGRPHQLRVAAATLGCPLLGDLKYGADAPLPDRSIALHAHELALTHPTTKELLTFAAPLPDAPWWRELKP